MDLVGILYSAHVQQTAQPNPPFSHNLSFNYEKINKTKYKSLGTEQNLNDFVNVCFEKYKQRNPNHRTGTLDRNLKTWTKFALKSIVNAYKAKTDIIIFPNGCCSLENCPINLFYEIVLEEICLE